ncbi:MAG: VWA domain-containing protein [Thermoguttaceae bacterium]|nr:VWA domain-containing protein [Thermoguttaceae bacterium]
MTWTSKYWLWGLWLLPILALLFRHAAVGARRRGALFAEPPIADRLAPTRSGIREGLRAALVLTGVALMLVAAAGPRGAGELVRVERKGADIQILLDISRSMLSDDVKPNRLESAKLDISDLLEKVRGDRVGLIAFAGRPTVKIPLTSDAAFFREALRPLSTADATRGGTAIGEAIRLALRSVDPESSRERAILLITDGEDHESDPIEAADQAASMGVKIYTVALGDADQGGRIPLRNDRGELTGYQKYKRKEIRTKADRDLLRQIAEKTGGAFLDMGKTPTDLGTFYRKSIDLKRTGYGKEDRRVWKEEFQPFLLAGILLLGFGCAVSPWRNKGKIAATLLFAALILAVPDGQVPAAPPSEDGVDFFDNPADGETVRNAPEAVPMPERKDNLSEPSNEDPEANFTAKELYNAACGLTERGEDDRAILYLQRALDLTGPREKSFRARVRYNLGVLQAKRLEADAERLFGEDDAPTGAKSPDPETSVSGPGANARPEDTVADYRRAAEKRNAAFADLRSRVFQAATTLRDAAAEGNRDLRADALRGSDLILSWGEGKSRAFSARERERRADLFSPVDQLRWLDEELTRLTEENILAKDPRGADVWQEIYEAGETLVERKRDLEDLLEKGILRDDEDPSVSAARTESAESALTSFSDAIRPFRAGEESATAEIREGIADLDRAALTYADYPTVVFDAVARQEEIVKRLAAPDRAGSAAEEAETETPPITRETLAARGGAILRRLDRMTADAREEFAQRPRTEAEENGTAPEDETETANADDTQEGEAETDFFADSSESAPSDAEPAAEPREELSAEERIRRSMSRALELEPKITAEENALSELPADAVRTEAPRHAETVLDLLRKIAEPLQDPNEENRQDRNQDQRNQNQQDSQQNEQNSGDSNQKPRDPPQEQNQDQQSENQDGQNRDQNPQGERDQDNRDQQNEGQEENREEMTPEEEEARRQEEKTDAMMRKVNERQRQVEALRRQRERHFRRYEKPEKDW